MSDARMILNDRDLLYYGDKHTYYTCFPRRDNTVGYECLNGGFDPSFSDNYTKYDVKSWKEISVPKLIPESLHKTYLNYKLKQRLNVDIVNKK
jgi:hypothetical protein